MIFKNIPIILVAALAPAPLFATDYDVSPDKSLDLSEIADGQSEIYNLNITVKNPEETSVSTIEKTAPSSNRLSIQDSSLSLNQGVLNIINNYQGTLTFDSANLQLGSESSTSTVKTNGSILFSGFHSTSSIVNTNLYIESHIVQFFQNSNVKANFNTITVNNNASLRLYTNAVHRSANLLIEHSGSAISILQGNNSSQAGFISDSTLSNLNIKSAAITHKSHLTLDNVVLSDSTLTANNLTLVQRDVDASQTLSITSVATITGDLTLDVYLADIDSLGAEFSFSADGISGLTDSNLAINFYDSLTNELYATGTDFTHNGGVYTSSVEYIPEPSTATLSLLALAGLLARRRRKAA